MTPTERHRHAATEARAALRPVIEALNKLDISLAGEERVTITDTPPRPGWTQLEDPFPGIVEEWKPAFAEIAQRLTALYGMRWGPPLLDGTESGYTPPEPPGLEDVHNGLAHLIGWARDLDQQFRVVNELSDRDQGSRLTGQQIDWMNADISRWVGYLQNWTMRLIQRGQQNDQGQASP